MVEADGGGAGGMTPEEAMQAEYDESKIDWLALLIGTFLCFLMLWCSGNISFSSGKDPRLPREEDDRETEWTIEELNRYDGKGPDGKIYIACNGFVFDVTSSENYAPDGDYYMFCGHDISVACANYSTEEKYIGVPFDPDNHKLNFS